MEATHLYAWDRAPRGIGRLDEIDAGLNRLAFDYDLAGHTTTRVYTRGVIALAVRADHDPVTGLLDTLTYPSGAAIQYQYDTAGRISGLTWDGEPIADQLQYTAFSAIKALRLANGLDHLRAHDSAGRIASYTLAGETVQIGYDAAGRLTGYQAPTRTETHAYDASGNRLSRTVNGQTTAYQYLANSNRLQTLDALVIAHDAAGNRLADLGRQYVHDSAGRLVQLAAGATLARYEYNGLGERALKQVGAELRYFAYDAQGHLLGEYDATGQPLAEYAWLGDLPVAYRAYRQVNGLAQTDLYAVEADHLGTPRALTDAAQHLRWRWHSAPFGDTIPDENPAGLGPVTFNLRFPGQYYDAESGLHYNTFRDYDPQTGRYVQSDPIGLAGGINTYGYVEGNPVNYSDPFGLFAPTESALLTCVAGGPANPACGGAIIVNACKWIGIGVIALSSFYSGKACGGGDSSYDKPACNDDPYDKCKKNQEALEYVRKEIINILRDSNLLFYTQRICRYNNAARIFNREIEKHSTVCPHNKVNPLPILGTLDGENM